MNNGVKTERARYIFPNGAMVVSQPKTAKKKSFLEKRANFQMTSVAFSSLDSLSEILTKQQAEIEMLYIQLRDAKDPQKEAHLRSHLREALASLYSTTDSYKRMIINLASVDM
ncbi:MAG: hypothetical protein Q8P99_00060 [bacterium]|nr:hypothetical protein [bacterium]MDZ4231551.1 hypothetical protein [Patescibacteria group bacterium]